MLRYFSLLLFSSFLYCISAAQRVLGMEEAVQLALNNQRNVRAGNLSVQQQKQLLKGSAAIENPQLQYQLSPYDEGSQVGVQQTIGLPSLYRNRKALQNERLALAQLQLLGTQYDLKREVGLSYLQLQYLAARQLLLRFQDSTYQAIKISSKRFFEAGQINKLEELQATTQAERIRNELNRNSADSVAENYIFRFYTDISDSFIVAPMYTFIFEITGDTAISNIQQQILQKEIAISQRELKVAKSELLPELQAGVLFPTAKEYQRFVGYQIGLTIPVWRKQNRSRIAAAGTGIEMARAQQELQQQKLNAQFRQALTNYQREVQSLSYFDTTGLPLAKAIIETSQRLFQGGELNYVESLRNLQLAFDIMMEHLETLRLYNEAVIQLNYLKGKL